MPSPEEQLVADFLILYRMALIVARGNGPSGECARVALEKVAGTKSRIEQRVRVVPDPAPRQTINRLLPRDRR